MTKFWNRPLSVEAFRWFPELGAGNGVEIGPVFTDEDGCQHEGAFIRTLEGRHRVTPGDWIITDGIGVRRLCKPDVFAMSYQGTDPHELARSAIAVLRDRCFAAINYAALTSGAVPHAHAEDDVTFATNTSKALFMTMMMDDTLRVDEAAFVAEAQARLDALYARLYGPPR